MALDELVSDDRIRYREVDRIIKGYPTSDGAGVRLTRYIGSPELNDLDPFLLLAFFESENPDDYIAGFPSHPHRGFETVTYLLAGKVRHEDSAGHGAGTPRSKQIEAISEIYGFALNEISKK